MLRFCRLIGNIALWLVAGIGVVAGAFWLASAAGLVEPLIVISGSMEPGIDTGDLLIATRVDTADLRVGDVVSLPSELVSKLVTHRIIEISPLADGQWQIEMQGDANPGPDIAPYIVGDEVWKPRFQLGGMGSVLGTVMQPGVVIPAVIALAAFLGFSILGDDDDDDDDEEEEEEEEDEKEEDADNDNDVERPVATLTP